MHTSFHVAPLSPQLCSDMMRTGSWKADCPVPLERLRCVYFTHHDFDGNADKQGEMIVLDAVAAAALEVFKILHARGFQIAGALGIHAFGGSDDASMDANNSSAFNWRPIAGTSQISIHGYGLAIDINPVQNPFVRVKTDGTCQYFPGEAHPYVNRFVQRPGMVEPIVDAFRDHGFTEWGGAWITPIDLHHFQVPRLIAEILTHLPFEESAMFFEEYIDRTRGTGRNIALEKEYHQRYLGSASF